MQAESIKTLTDTPIVLVFEETRALLKDVSKPYGTKLTLFLEWRRTFDDLGISANMISISIETTSRVANFVPESYYNPSERL